MYEFTGHFSYLYIEGKPEGVLLQMEDPDHMTQVMIPYDEIGYLRMSLLEMERGHLGGLDA